MTEDELVGTVLGDEPTVDEAAQMPDELLLVHAGHSRQHVERCAPSEHGRGVDHPPFVAAQSVELAANDLGERERQRLRSEGLGLGIARGAQDLLEEERVASRARVEGVGRLRRQRPSVDACEEVRDLRLGEPVEPQVMHGAPSVEAHEQIGRREEGAELV